ncbi:MAG: ATP-binding protein [Prevotella sp.]|nr:ATP-binding protein [Prevotella sp.]
MNTEMTLNRHEERVTQVMNLVADAVRRPLGALSSYYSRVLERPISNRQTLLMLNVQLAFVLTVFTSCSLVVRILFVCWLVGAVLKCKEEL